MTGRSWSSASEELAEASSHAPPPTDDDVTVTWDGRVINTKEKLLAWLGEIDAEGERV
jgi:hypothetical protein